MICVAYGLTDSTNASSVVSSCSVSGISSRVGSMDWYPNVLAAAAACAVRCGVLAGSSP